MKQSTTRRYCITNLCPDSDYVMEELLPSSISITLSLENEALDGIMGEEVLNPGDPITYYYEAFEDKESIRVLTLFPSKSLVDEIQIKLSIVKLIDNPNFEALSYTWGTISGDASLNSIVHCSGGQIKVTRNCEDALRRLRRENEERVLWVDAICINQQDNKEKSHQVAFMGSIYQHATQAVIWLGDASETVDEKGQSVSDLFFDHLATITVEMRNRNLDPLTGAALLSYRKLTCQASDYITNGTITPLVQGFLDVVLRPWWERVWVVQEAALSKAAIVICGGKTADYMEMYNLFMICFADADPESIHDSGLTISLMEGYKHHMTSIIHVRDYSRFLSPHRVLLGVLDRCRRLQSTDQRDNIFAIFGMFGDLRYALPLPDYRKNPQGLFVEMTQVFFDTDSLDILQHVTNVEEHSDIPSWVVDFSQRPKFHIPHASDVYDAAAQSEGVYKISDCGKELQLLGTCVDVLEVIPKAPVEGYYNPYVPKKAILGYQQDVRVGRSILEYPTGEDPEEVLWRTMCWNLDETCIFPASDDIGMHFQHFSRALMSGKEVDVIEKEILLEDSCGFNDICIHSMPLCITEIGYLASVPWTAQEGDRIFLFSGSQVPIVLREDPVGKHYRFIGACYVHGIMQGEAFPEDSNTLEWFSIR